jgi:vitamin K-dependent gamma-carboxylase
VSWHEQGHQFSWQMMLRTKAGAVRFVVRDPATGQTWYVEPEEHLDDRQVRKMATHPEMIRQFAHYLARVWAKEQATPNAEVRVLSATSLNGRPAQPLIDPTRDLTKVEFSLRPVDWVLPWPGPLPPREKLWPDDIDEALERFATAQTVATTGATAPEEK